MAYHIITKLFHHPRLLSLSYVLPAFDVMTFRHFDIDDDIIREMISAWPLLQTLKMSRSRRIASPVTLLGLSDLLQGCTQLKELYISMCVSAHEVKALINARAVPNRSIS